MDNIYDWKVVGYDAKDDILTMFYIRSRTREEARIEAENDLPIILSARWSINKLTECDVCGSLDGYSDSNCPNCGAIVYRDK